jgi:hypothetical protein
VSLAQTAQNLFAKSLLLISASHFEHGLKTVLAKGVALRSRNDPYIMTFFEKRGIAYQYHTWFDWDKRNANKFCSFFGPEFANAVKTEVDGDTDNQLSESIVSFLKVGDLRNQIVHGNMLAFSLNDTPEQILEHIRKASRFVTLVEKIICSRDENSASSPSPSTAS